MKKKTTVLAALLCLLISISGCGDSSKEQTITIFDYAGNKETAYDISNEKIDAFVNSICDYLLEEESETIEIPKEAFNYIRINVFQGKQKMDENKMINMEILTNDNVLYCNAYFSFSDCKYTVKLSDDIAKQLEALEDSFKTR